MTGAIDISLKARRLAIFERVKAKLAANGQPMREDANFLRLIDRWAEGEIDLDEVITGYLRHAEPLRRGSDEFSGPETPIKSDEVELLGDLERVIGMIDLSDSNPES